MRWDTLVQQVRTQIRETSESFFKDQEIKRTAHFYQQQIAAAIGGIDMDFDVFFNFVAETSISKRCLRVHDVYYVLSGEQFLLYQMGKRPIILNEAQTNEPMIHYFLREEEPTGAVLGLYPTGESGTTGTGTISSSGTTVTGVGTAFLTDISVGQYIKSGTQKRQVTVVTNDTSLTTATAFSPALSGASYSIGMHCRVRGKGLPLLGGFRITYSGTASRATCQVTTAAVVLRTTTGGVVTTSTLSFATYLTYSALLTAINAVSGFSADTEHENSDATTYFEPTKEIECKGVYIDFFETIKIGAQFDHQLVKFTSATMLGSDKDHVGKRMELALAHDELRKMENDYKTQKTSAVGCLQDSYAYNRFYIAERRPKNLRSI